MHVRRVRLHFCVHLRLGWAAAAFSFESKHDKFTCTPHHEAQRVRRSTCTGMVRSSEFELFEVSNLNFAIRIFSWLKKFEEVRIFEYSFQH